MSNGYTTGGGGNFEPATHAGDMGLEDEPVHLRIRSAHPGQRDSDCIDLVVMPFNTWHMVKQIMKEFRRGLKNISEKNIRLLHKGIELRSGHDVERYIHCATDRFSPAEIQFVVMDPGELQANDVAMYIDETVPALAELVDLVNEVSDAMMHGIKPMLTEDGTGATYLLRGASSQKTRAVFKPKDEEAFAPNNPRGYTGKENTPGLRRGVLSTQQAAREVAAYLLDHKKFAGVPPTTLVHAKHPSFVNPNNKVAWKSGAFQKFVHSQGTSEDYRHTMFATSSVQRIGILDVRIVNLDRNDGNLLVVLEGRVPKLVPIDHGLSLPDRLEVESCDVVWMDWNQAKEPFGPEEMDYIRGLSGAQDAKNLERQVGVRRECLRLMEATTMLLQKGAEHGLTLHQIGLIMYREDKCSDDDTPVQPSIMEKMISRCVDSALAVCGRATGTVSSTLDSLDLLQVRVPSPLRRQVSGDESYAPSPLPSPMFSPAICKLPQEELEFSLDGFELDADQQIEFARAVSPDCRGDHSPGHDLGRETQHEDQTDEPVGRRKMRGSAARHRSRLSARGSVRSGASTEGSGKDASTAIFARPRLDGSNWPERMEEVFKRHLNQQLTDYFKKYFSARSKTIVESDEEGQPLKRETSLASAFRVRPCEISTDT
ncbi:unnamed protein product [Effrenium voratum]|nr:unnamed protein product [Effrenium voratum]CAJ1439731.1 unnamed protein product [Effrenium voratum]